MPKTSGIPKSILAEINRLKVRLASLEKSNASLKKEFKSTGKTRAEWIKKREQTIAQLAKKSAKREKRKPSAYNLFLKDKMSHGMTMVEAVNAWKRKYADMPTSPTAAAEPYGHGKPPPDE